ncbi:MAG: gamma carbonic anhydrase family protein [Chloroflexi bacterium]|nr:gamma carbonic anhydrase family protein [Chloroflexota bacterium]
MIIEHHGKLPTIGANVFIAPTAVLIGDVEIAENSSVWFGAVLRGDHGRIVIGRGSNVQDNVTVHVPEGGETLVGENVTIGHGAVLEGCVIERGALIGINAAVLNGARVGEHSMIAAGCVVAERMSVPPRMLAAGVPAKIKKELDGSSSQWVEIGAAKYHALARTYLDPES